MITFAMFQTRCQTRLSSNVFGFLFVPVDDCTILDWGSAYGTFVQFRILCTNLTADQVVTRSENHAYFSVVANTAQPAFLLFFANWALLTANVRL